MKMKGETNFRTTDSTLTYRFQKKKIGYPVRHMKSLITFIVNNMWYDMVLNVFAMEGRGNYDYERR